MDLEETGPNGGECNQLDKVCIERQAFVVVVISLFKLVHSMYSIHPKNVSDYDLYFVSVTLNHTPLLTGL
jgi:hypothetical protein